MTMSCGIADELIKRGFRSWGKTEPKLWRLYFNPPKDSKEKYDEHVYCYIDRNKGDKLFYNDIRLAYAALKAAGDYRRFINFRSSDEKAIKEYWTKKQKEEADAEAAADAAWEAKLKAQKEKEDCVWSI